MKITIIFLDVYKIIYLDVYKDWNVSRVKIKEVTGPVNETTCRDAFANHPVD